MTALTLAHDTNGGPTTWTARDLTEVLAGSWAPPEPDVGARNDGVGLFYPGKAHTVSGESESMKTWLVLAATLDELAKDNYVMFIDFEDDVGPVVNRLLLMGASPERLRRRFLYVRPEAPLSERTGWADLEVLLGEARPSLAVIDGVTEGMTLHGLNPLDNKDAATFGRLLPRRLASYGAAAVSLDHLTKSAESRGRYAIGAVHKLNALDGAAYVIENRRPAGIGLVGVSSVKIAKDRPGQLRKHAVPSGGMHWFADLVLDSTTPGHVEASVRAPEAQQGEIADARPTFMMQRVSEALAEYPQGLAQRIICDVVKGKAETIRRALSHLIAEGYVTDKTPHRVVKPFTQDGGEQ